MTTEAPVIPKASADIQHHPGGGSSIVGPDAIKYYRACQLKGALKLYAKIGMIPTRGVTITVMLKIAKEYTGKTYKRGDAMKAHDDMEVWCNTMKASLDIRNPGDQRAQTL